MFGSICKARSRKPGGLEIVQAFLEELLVASSISGLRLLRNAGEGSRTRMPKFPAAIEFRDEAQFSAAFSDQAARGIHAGLHGLMITVVTDFRAELFKQITGPANTAETEPPFQQACEI